MTAPRPVEIRVGMGSCGIASGARRVAQAIEEEIRRTRAPARLVPVGCNGMCFSEPIVEIVAGNGDSRTFGNVTPGMARRIVCMYAPPASPFRRALGLSRRIVDRLTDDRAWAPMCDYQIDLDSSGEGAYLKNQERIVLRRAGQGDPLDLDDYLAHGGYSALRRCLMELKPDDVIDIVTRSGLRGRGGAGYPTGAKWRVTRDQPSEEKFVICNADEGDPGAFMDRSVLESSPYQVLEGMAIAAYAVGAAEGYIFIRAEYPLAVKRMSEAIRLAEEKGWLGEDIQGSGFDLKLHVFESAGAFVCGEETALIASIEGRRGTPRVRPPYPAEHGLWGRPTLINNVETLGCLSWIIGKGPEAFSALGTEGSKGTKIFALAGQVRRGGLVEVPMGTTVWDIVHQIGGGVPEGREFKAVQIGGPSGGCLPARLCHTPIDYDALRETGMIMGSGGLVVLDDSTCMVDFARFFLPFTQNESCGKCTFCRIGSKRMLEILDRICEGTAKERDLEALEELAGVLKSSSFCGLGRTAPNPVVTSLRYFREEYEAHLEGRCPAGKCRALIKYVITDRCIGCTVCAQNCPAEAIAVTPYEKHEIDLEKCVRCGMCKVVCPQDAVDVE
ncbi:MAG: 4Fe-4S dicluster domain-containing protein [Planctomycetes bacterium]|nr:4Fe-4S dicluster domain-containing protein [Planctomycetota bacterium]